MGAPPLGALPRAPWRRTWRAPVPAGNANGPGAARAAIDHCRARAHNGPGARRQASSWLLAGRPAACAISPGQLGLGAFYLLPARASPGRNRARTAPSLAAPARFRRKHARCRRPDRRAPGHVRRPRPPAWPHKRAPFTSGGGPVPAPAPARVSHASQIARHYANLTSLPVRVGAPVRARGILIFYVSVRVARAAGPRPR